MSPRVSRTGRDHAERVDGPATSERRYGEEVKEEEGRGEGGRREMLHVGGCYDQGDGGRSREGRGEPGVYPVFEPKVLRAS